MPVAGGSPLTLKTKILMRFLDLFRKKPAADLSPPPGGQLSTEKCFNDGQIRFLHSVLSNDLEAVAGLLANEGQDQLILGEALVLAAGKRLELVKLLVEHGANVNAVGYRLHTPLIVALGERRFSIVEYLLAEGAVDPAGQAGDGLSKARGQSSSDKDLLLAIKTNNMELFLSALQNGADINSTDQNKHSALTIAKRRKRKRMATMLRKRGAVESAESKNEPIYIYKTEPSDQRVRMDNEICALRFSMR